ncbi:MAG TPA: agmatine deiminase family protein [Steroidobacteraceae bacterium]|jgi:agmatine deiminase
MPAHPERPQIDSTSFGTLMLETPLAAGFRMPPEWARHECCWMAWPSREDQWVDGLAGAQRTYASIARAIRRFEPVRMVAEPSAVQEAQDQLGAGIDVVSFPIDDPWMRDSGPTFLLGPSGMRAGTAWRFNAWGGKVPQYAENARLARRVLGHAGAPTYHSSLCLEGGGIQTDGEGTIITTESVVLNPNRNPGITKEAAEREICDALGARKVIWLPGDPEGVFVDITDGHIDGLLSFVKPGMVLFESDPSASGAAKRLAADNRRALETAEDAAGRRLQIVSIDDAYEVQTPHQLFCRSYVNFYVANGGIVMPSYGVPGDARARAVIQACFPEREIVQIDVSYLASGGGGIHCITQQQPAWHPSA